MKKALMTASVASMLDNFNRSNIKLLLEAGYEVTLAANFGAEEDSSPLARIASFRAEMEALGCHVVQIDFSRKIGNIPKQFRSYRQLKRLAKEDFTLVHCNSPICAAMTRLVFRKKRKTHGIRVIYTAHGFHFFRGAPIRNWLLYFPAEWICARWTDILNTINREDYWTAKKWLKAGQVVRLPGVGIDLQKFHPGSADRDAVRRKLGIGENETLLLSVGELIRRKNQASVIQALAILINGNTNTYVGRRQECPASARGKPAPDWRISGLRYVICGQGETEGELKALVSKLGLTDRVLFLGFREDIADICQAADLFVFPSLQEGLPMALMEAIAVKAPVICSDIRGNRELVGEKELRFDPRKPKDIAESICRALDKDMSEMAENHYKKIKHYGIAFAMKKMKAEYGQ